MPFGIFVAGNIPADPSNGPLVCFSHARTNGGSLDHVIEGHHDVGAYVILEADGVFRANEYFRLVVGRLELHSFLADLAKLAE